MFWQKKKQKIEQKYATARIRVIPDVFYGARDPVVYFKTESSKKKNNGKEPQQRFNRLALAEGVGVFFQKKWARYVGLGLVFLFMVALISVYYLKQAGLLNFGESAPAEPDKEQNAKIENETTSAALLPEKKAKESELATSTTTSSPIEEATTTLVFEEKELTFPNIFLADSVDLDNDLLTDAEEEVYDTDSGKWDTDGDGYYDGQEVFNLYNPQGVAPMKIIDSGLVQEYINPTWKYRFYYPISWQIGAVDPEANQVLASSITGDFIEVASFKKESGDTFQDWFARKATGQKYSDLETFTNRFLETGHKRKDELVVYFVSENNVYVLLYHSGTTGFIHFRHVMNMLTQSFRPSKTMVDIPLQTILPVVEIINNTGTIQ